MFYVLTRRYTKAGKVIKGSRTFQTRRAQRNYIAKAPISIVITGYN